MGKSLHFFGILSEKYLNLVKILLLTKVGLKSYKRNLKNFNFGLRNNQTPLNNLKIFTVFCTALRIISYYIVLACRYDWLIKPIYINPYRFDQIYVEDENIQSITVKLEILFDD